MKRRNTTLENLLTAIDGHLTADGSFSVLLPFHRNNYFEEAAARLHFGLCKKILVKQTPRHNHFRSILIFSRKPSAFIQKEITIKNEAGNYSGAFIGLLKDYYLHL